MYKKLSLSILFLFLSMQPAQSMTSYVPTQVSYKTPLIAVILAASAYIGYEAAVIGNKKIQEYVENKIVDTAVDAIVLMFTKNSTLQKLPAKKQEAALRKKARLINIRKRVLIQLNEKLEDTDHKLSSAHYDNLHGKVKMANIAFAIIDAVREENPYEKEYAQAGAIDKIIETKIIESIILETKPDSECTPGELKEKEIKAVRRAKILEKLKSHLHHAVVAQLPKIAFILDAIIS